MPLAPAIEAPPATPTTPVPATADLPNPVIPPDFEQSKANFRTEMEKANAAPVVAPEASEEEKPAETPKPEEKPVEKATEPKKEGVQVPQELLDGKKEESKVDPTIAEIDSMVLPKNAKPEQVASFGKLKETAKKAVEEKLSRIAELESKVSDGSTKAEIEAAQARVKAAEDKAKELESTVERLAFMESPKFKAFLSEETASLEGAKSYLSGTEINPAVIDLAAHNSGAKRLQVLRDAGLESDQIGAVTSYLLQYDAIQRSKAASMDNWKTENAQHQEQEKARAEASKAQRTAEEDRVWNTILGKARTDLLPLRKTGNSPEWDNQSDELAAQAKRIFNGEGVPLEEFADVVIRGVASRVQDKVLEDLKSEVNTLRAQNAKLTAAKPGGGDGEGLKLDTPPAEETPEQRAKRTFNVHMAAVGAG